MSGSPYTCCRTVHTKCEQVRLSHKLVNTIEHGAIHRIIYKAFHEQIYKVGATTCKLISVYTNRWCKPHLINEFNVAAIVLTACKYLKWFPRRVPPRVHIANTRFHFNGWHTRRRYQNRQDLSCMFCKAGEDNIEHFVHCKAIQQLFPLYLRTGNPPKVPVVKFFLRGLDGRHCLTFALVIYAIYRIHNKFRHSSDHTDFKRCCLRIIADVPLRPEFVKAWKEILCPYGS